MSWSWRKSRPDKDGYYFGRNGLNDPVPCEVYINTHTKDLVHPRMIWPVNMPQPFKAEDDFWKGWDWLGPFTVTDVQRALRIKRRELETATPKIECGAGI